MHPLKQVIAISCYLLLFTLAQRPTQAFWLTDGSLFRELSSKQVVVVEAGTTGGDLIHPAALDTSLAGKQQQVVQDDSLAPIETAGLNDRRAARPAGQSGAASGAAQVANNDTPTPGAATLANDRGNMPNNSLEPWVRLADISSIGSKRNDDAQATQTKASSQEGKIVNQMCQCSSDWLQNQTNHWLSKWMSSADFANNLKQSIVSISNVPSSGQPVHRIGQTTNGSSRSLAWNRTSKRNSNASNASGGGDGIGSDAKSSGTPRVTSPDRHRNTGRHASNFINNNNNNKHHQYSQQPVKLVQGEQGPKGERGPPGERGPSALISVKDRDSLFDLDLADGQQQQQQQGADSGPKVVEKSLDQNRLALAQNNKQQRRPSGARLAFIESEQMLVVETSLGWRPVPMLAPLKDFRKTIAKFSLNSAEDRRRLIITGADSSQQRDSHQLSGRKSVAIHLSDSPTFLFANTSENQHLNNILNAIEGKNGFEDAEDDDADDGDDDEDDDDDEEEDSDDNEIDKEFNGENKREGRRENNADDDEDGDDKDDDDDDEDDDNEIGMDDYDDSSAGPGDKRGANASGAAMTRAKFGPISESSKMLPTSGTNQVSDGTKTKRRRAQASGRSGVSSAAGGLRAVVETNSIASNSQAPRSASGRQTTGDEELSELGPSSRSTSSLTTSNQASPPSLSPAGPLMKGDAMKLRLIALNEPFAGNQHGLRGANFECKRHAARANVKGAFRALLATNYQNLNEIVRYNSHVHKFPIVNLRGETLASSWHDLFKSPARVANPLSRIYSFDGRHVASDPNWPNKLVWHGAGNKFGQRDSAHNCDGWHSDSLSKFGFASPLHSPRPGFGHVKHQSAPKKRTNQHRRRFADVEQSPSVTVAKRDEEQHPASKMAQATQSSNSTAKTRNRLSSSLVFETIEKYPCRMPLIVLCIETIAQAD